jgi:hypothetical protein
MVTWLKPEAVKVRLHCCEFEWPLSLSPSYNETYYCSFRHVQSVLVWELGETRLEGLRAKWQEIRGHVPCYTQFCFSHISGNILINMRAWLAVCFNDTLLQIRQHHAIFVSA